jgi:tetrapyrrole methylase family protein/MazG family protein
VENSKIEKNRNPLSALISLVESLRGEGGCPWDKKQTTQSMLIYLIEEMYELVDAIESDDADSVREELGDVLFHIIFISHLFQEKGDFGIDDVARDIASKMIRRHPHVFGTDTVKNTNEVRQNWQKIKQNEKKTSAKRDIIDSVPRSMPALMRAYQIGERTARYGFNRKNCKDSMAALESDFERLKQTIESNDADRTLNDFGRYLLSLVNLARLLKIHPETALSSAVRVYEQQFRETIEKDSSI